MKQPEIINDFLELVRLEVNSLQERKIADRVSQKLKDLGFEVEEDDCGSKIKGQAGNIIARLLGDPQIPPLLFSAHLDRVDNHGHIQPAIVGDLIKSDGSSILGADDVSGICAILDGIRRIKAENIPHGDLEVVFSVAEEIGLLGARFLDYSKLKAKMAYVLDTGGPLNTLINAGPTQYSIVVKVHGRSAHAGLEPEKGLNAIKVAAVALAQVPEGRLSPVTTANFGVFEAGKATNIVCDYAEIKGEVRSRSAEELEAYIQQLKEVFSEVEKRYKARIELDFHHEYSAFEVDKNEEIVKLAARAMRKLGLEIDIKATGGGMDGNFFNQNGLKAVALSPGYQKVHTNEETQPVSLLMDCGRLVAEIIKESSKERK